MAILNPCNIVTDHLRRPERRRTGGGCPAAPGLRRGPVQRDLQRQYSRTKPLREAAEFPPLGWGKGAIGCSCRSICRGGT